MGVWRLHACTSAGGQPKCTAGPLARSSAACKHHTFGVCAWIIEQPDRKLTNDGDPLELLHNILIWGNFTLLSDSLSFSTSSIYMCALYTHYCVCRSLSRSTQHAFVEEYQRAGGWGNCHKKKKRGKEEERKCERERASSSRVSRAPQELLRSVCRFAPAS